MINFLKWLVSSNNIYPNTFTFLTVILSALASWAISAKYALIGERNNLCSSILLPMKRILEDSYSWKNYKELERLSKEYSSRYLKKDERVIINRLLESYKKACSYDYDAVCAESLFSYFNYKLQKKGIDTKPVPILIEGEIVDMDFPDELLYMRDDLISLLKKYPIEYDEDMCQEKIELLYSDYCKSAYNNEVVTYFDDYSLSQVLEKAQNRKEWNEKLGEIQIAKNEFLKIKLLDNYQ